MPVDYSGQDLRGRHFLGQNLTGADFSGADLQGATFWQSDLTSANLSGADLTDAFLFRADLTGADLTDVIGYTRWSPPLLPPWPVDETTAF